MSQMLVPVQVHETACAWSYYQGSLQRQVDSLDQVPESVKQVFLRCENKHTIPWEGSDSLAEEWKNHKITVFQNVELAFDPKCTREDMNVIEESLQGWGSDDFSVKHIRGKDGKLHPEFVAVIQRIEEVAHTNVHIRKDGRDPRRISNDHWMQCSRYFFERGNNQDAVWKSAPQVKRCLETDMGQGVMDHSEIALHRTVHYSVEKKDSVFRTEGESVRDGVFKVIAKWRECDVTDIKPEMSFAKDWNVDLFSKTGDALFKMLEEHFELELPDACYFWETVGDVIRFLEKEMH